MSESDSIGCPVPSGLLTRRAAAEYKAVSQMAAESAQGDEFVARQPPTTGTPMATNGANTKQSLSESY